MLRDLVQKSASKIGISYVLRWIRGAAEGRKGPAWKERYWKLAGYKTWIGFGLAVASAALLGLGYPEAALGVGTAAGFAIQAGLIDKAWRKDIPEALREAWLYRFMAANAELVTGLFGVLATYMAQCDGRHCEALTIVFAILTAAAIQLGLLDAAWRAKPPAEPLSAVARQQPADATNRRS